jgi:hypothetical protein
VGRDKLVIRIPARQGPNGPAALTGDELSTAVEAVLRDGFVVLEDAVSLVHLDKLRDRMLADLPVLLERTDAPYNFNTGNIQQDPPPFPPFLLRDVLLNEAAISVTAALLGPGVKNAYYSGNTCLPSSQEQPWHVDTGQLWRGLPAATPPFGLVVNVPVVEMTPENGSTQLWPATHLDTSVAAQDGDIKIPQAALDKWGASSTPVQPHIRLGSILIRDLRLWHRGMPNHTPVPRPMIAMIHWIRWRQTRAVRFETGSEELLRHPILNTHAEFVPAPIAYLKHNRAYDFTPAAPEAK